MATKVQLAKRLENLGSEMDRKYAYDSYSDQISRDPEWLRLMGVFVELTGTTPLKFCRKTEPDAITDQEADLMHAMLRVEANYRARPVAGYLPFRLATAERS
jgi:hypothetical protein